MTKSNLELILTYGFRSMESTMPRTSMAWQQRWKGEAQRQSRLITSHKILKANESGERLYILKVCLQ